MRILVTGSNGLVGTKVLERLLQDPTAEPLAAYHQTRTNEYLGDVPFWWLDVTAPPTSSACSTRPGRTPSSTPAPSPTSTAPSASATCAWASNAEGTGILARACAARGIRLVYLSTEYVFDGTAGPYRETDPVNPLGWYAKTKEAGEQAVDGGGRQLGHRPDDRGLRLRARTSAPTSCSGWSASFERGERVRIVDDQIGSPTLAENLAEMVLALAASRENGVFNTAGADVISRLEFSRQIAATFGLDASLMDPITHRRARAGRSASAQGRPADGQAPRDVPGRAGPRPREGLAIVKRQFEQAGLVEG